MLIYPMVFKESLILIEAVEAPTDPDSFASFGETNKQLLKTILAGVATFTISKVTSKLVNDFYSGLVGNAPYKIGEAIKNFIIKVWNATIGKGVDKLKSILDKAYQMIVRYSKKPKVVAGFLLMVAGIVLLSIVKAIPKPTEPMTDPSAVRKYAKMLYARFNSLSRNKTTIVGVTLFTFGAALFIWGLFGG